MTVRLFLDRDDPEITSLVDTVPGASMYEREVMDMLGVEFEGHPKPERLMLADDWEAGPPMRKPDPVVEEEGEEGDEEAEAEESDATDEAEESTEDSEADEASTEEEEATEGPTDETETTDDSEDTDDTDDTDEEGDTES